MAATPATQDVRLPAVPQHADAQPVDSSRVALLPRENWVPEATLPAACTELLLVQLIIGSPSAASAPRRKLLVDNGLAEASELKAIEKVGGRAA